jgi:2-keto-4-pentenoate hydratase/2-oxohepta-3-ene-1,7-dioic acid hydratase in catechol pathway
MNYANRNADFGDPDVPKHPSMFLSSSRPARGRGRDLVQPRVSEQLDCEGEIAPVAGRAGRPSSRTLHLDRQAGQAEIRRRRAALAQGRRCGANFLT